MSITRREFLKRAGSVVGAAACAASDASMSAEAAAKRTNVLIFMSDEHNPRYSSVYRCEGYPDFIRTPNMEALAKRGVVFENAYCPSPLCMPSRSSLMSG